jgi:type II restriction/modification system DNA methylase subunit YeeA
MTEQFTYRTNRDLFSNYYLNNHLRQTEPWNEVDDAEVEEAYNEINDLWDNKKDRVVDYNEAQLERNFIRPIFDILGIPFEIEETVMRNARRPDYGFFPSTEAADAAFDRDDFYHESIAVADAKRWGRKLDTRGEEKRDFENPSYQIHRYLQETPTQWAVLTNGEKWRLYYGPTSHRLDSYYEIDLPKLLNAVDDEEELEVFKEFYLFFRQGAFLPDQTGDCFLDDVYDESSVFAEELGEDLQENIYEAIRVLAEGFLETNDELDEADLDLIHDSSLIYLYRLIFVLYAESEGRNLLPTDNDIYSGSYSLNELKQTVVENRNKTQQQYQTWQTDLWDRLEQLFVLIDQGSQGQDIPKEDLYIPAYNGGLFRTNPDDQDSQEALFLSNHEAGDAYIAEVIELLTRHDASEGEGKVFVDYSSLDERNLGSIYEGLLEYKLDVADEPLTVDDGEYSPVGGDDDITVEEGDVYLRTDDGERKATGSYYTPEYIVEYIVDETLGPLVDEISENMLAESARGDERGFAEEFAERVFDLTVLDPAMGSGHFPVNAVDYLAREIINAQEQQDRQALDSGEGEVRAPTTEDGELRDINWARRKVAQRCIYGVDVNPLATELSKVSLWLRTLAAEQPLAFLDHHLKTGNSLVGSDIEDVLTDSDDSTTEDGQLTLQQSFDHTRKRAMEHVTDRFQDLLNIDNETLEDAKEMEAVYDEVREDPLYRKLLAMTDVHTADAFGLDIPDDADERMARALHTDAWENIEQQDWFKSAQAMAEDEYFFHWELEFPMAFYDQDGSRKDNAGFDAVIGNPPYVKIQNLRSSVPAFAEFIDEQYSTSTGRFDIYSAFVEKGSELAAGKNLSYILPNKFFESSAGEGLRRYISNRNLLKKILDFGRHQVFDGATTYTCILMLDAGEKFEYGQVDQSSKEIQDLREVRFTTIDSDNLSDDPWILTGPRERKLLNRINESGIPLGECTENLSEGIVSGDNQVLFVEILDEGEELTEVRVQTDNAVYEIESEIVHPLSMGDEIKRYASPDASMGVIYPYEETNSGSDLIPEQRLQSEYPQAYDYLSEYRSRLENRGSDSMNYPSWYSLWCPREKKLFESKKLLTPDICQHPKFTEDDHGGEYFADTAYGLVPEQNSEAERQFLLSILNSSLTWFYIYYTSPILRGDFRRFKTTYLEKIPIVPSQPSLDVEEFADEWGDSTFDNTVKESPVNALVFLGKKMRELHDSRNRLNLNILDYLGNYKEGRSLPDIGIFQPTNPEYLDATASDYEKLQIERARTKRDGPSVTIEATARYKPEEEDEFETDTYGYTETEFFDAFTLTDLSEKEAALVEAFVPVAVDKEIANFSDNATKNISLLDRLKAMQLPDPNTVAEDLRRYVENRERADELDTQIEKADDLIDEIVYDLYDLTDEEIAIVEEAIADD